MESFPRFDVVSDHSDHYYYTSPTACSSGESNVFKKIMREWKTLSKHLPESIYVRVYSSRVDLLRAVIVGAAGTPYHDGLFFFDAKFPPNYPNQPPHVYYHSHGLRLNPNLYPDGKVCLSLLNTWFGRRKELWDPLQSTILQVLVSIQGLVLNEKPFYNEPYRSRHFEEVNSRLYNEDAFIKTCMTTIYLLRRAPKNFELFTVEHFRDRANRILRACSAYANSRVGVGYYSDDVTMDTRISARYVSTTFVGSMKQLYPQLVQAFEQTKATNLEKNLTLENVLTPWAVAVGVIRRHSCLLLSCVALFCFFKFRA